MIDRVTRGGLYAELIDVCEYLASQDYSSASNALYVLAKQSPLYRQTLEELKRKRRRERRVRRKGAFDL